MKRNQTDTSDGYIIVRQPNTDTELHIKSTYYNGNEGYDKMIISMVTETPVNLDLNSEEGQNVYKECFVKSHIKGYTNFEIIKPLQEDVDTNKFKGALERKYEARNIQDFNKHIKEECYEEVVKDFIINFLNNENNKAVDLILPRTSDVSKTLQAVKKVISEFFEVPVENVNNYVALTTNANKTLKGKLRQVVFLAEEFYKNEIKK